MKNIQNPLQVVWCELESLSYLIPTVLGHPGYIWNKILNKLFKKKRKKITYAQSGCTIAHSWQGSNDSGGINSKNGINCVLFKQEIKVSCCCCWFDDEEDMEEDDEEFDGEEECDCPSWSSCIWFFVFLLRFLVSFFIVCLSVSTIFTKSRLHSW